MRKNEFWWLIWACHRHFRRYRVFKRQNWIKIMVFTIFFLGYFTTILLQKKWPNFEKKVLISEVANKTVLVFCMRPNKDTTYTPYLDHCSILYVWRRLYPIYLPFWVNQKVVFFCLFSKYGNFTALVLKTILNRFIYCSLVI